MKSILIIVLLAMLSCPALVLALAIPTPITVTTTTTVTVPVPPFFTVTTTVTAAITAITATATTKTEASIEQLGDKLAPVIAANGQPTNTDKASAMISGPTPAPTPVTPTPTPVTPAPTTVPSSLPTPKLGENQSDVLPSGGEGSTAVSTHLIALDNLKGLRKTSGSRGGATSS
ncbi:hypothetical protein B0T25DRAFT_628210 [Lasiosphaeria hispida]|uniref:Uncharacterized protein n=1 Tax=Lasiosphaeria hispida TaxID=260671 RepID=A0AAJ0HXA6_9PEZI|nr:hypothetical protein B0T25DRAFT_628210 [Lasiosphaeria hispida]